MSQASRESGAYENMFSAKETIRNRLKLDQAVKVLNRAIEGEQLPEQQVRYAYAVYNKEFASLQAVAIQVDHQVSTNMADLMLQAQQLGMTEADLFSTPETKQLILQEKVDSPEVIDEEGAPPDVAG